MSNLLSYRVPIYIVFAFISACSTEIAFKTESFFYAIGILTLLLYRIRLDKKIKIDFSWIILLYVIYATLSLLWTSNDQAGFILVTKLVAVFFLFIQLQYNYSLNEYIFLKKSLVLNFLSISLISYIYKYIGWDGRLWIVNDNVTTDGNSLASWMILPMCYFIECFINKESITQKIIYFSLILSNLYLTFLCGSRAGIISVGGVLLASFLYSFKKSLKKFGIAMCMILVGCLLFTVSIYMIPDTVIERFNNENTSQLGGRTSVWILIFDLLLNHPLALIFGFGESATISELGVVAHSLYIETLFDQGLIGVSLIFAFIFSALKKSMIKDPYMAIALIGISIMSASLSEFASRPVMLAFFFSAININDRKNNKYIGGKYE